jgi:hypothetical protein
MRSVEEMPARAVLLRICSWSACAGEHLPAREGRGRAGTAARRGRLRRRRGSQIPARRRLARPSTSMSSSKSSPVRRCTTSRHACGREGSRRTRAAPSSAAGALTTRATMTSSSMRCRPTPA